MGRFLLLLVAGALVAGTITMGAVFRTSFEQDVQVSSFEGDVVARENATSAMNQIEAYMTLARFDSLVAGQAVSTQALYDIAEETDSGDTLAGLQRLVHTDNRLQLVAGATRTLMPTRVFDGASANHARVRLLGPSTLEVQAEGHYLGKDLKGRPRLFSYTLRRTYGKALALDAALIVGAAAVEPSLNGTTKIDGRDTDLATLLPSGVAAYDRPGIKANAANVADRFAGSLGGQTSRVKGASGVGDIVSGPFDADLDALFDEAYASNTPDSITSATIGDAYYTSALPRLVVRRGDLTVAAGSELVGKGVLVVSGNLRGKVRWTGLVTVRKDKASFGSKNVTVGLAAGSKVIGSLVVLQNPSSLLMPFDGRVKVRYLSSSADMNSSVHVFHTRNGHAYTAQVAAPGSNRFGDVVAPYVAALAQGEQLSFAIGARYPTGSPYGPEGEIAYYHYGRGHFSASTHRPYGQVAQTGPFTWRIGFEDIDTEQPLGFAGADWDYDDQVIEVQLQC